MARFPGFQSSPRTGRDDPWFRVGSVDVNTTTLVAGLAALSMFVYAADPSVLLHLALTSDSVRSGKVWQLVSWPVPNGPSVWTVLMVFIFWQLGSRLEELMGRRRYLWFLGALVLLPALLMSLYSLLSDAPFALAGLRYLELGVFLAFAVEFPGVQFFFGIPARIIAIVIFVVEVLQALGDRNTPALLMIIATAAVALLALRAVGLGADVPWVPRVPLPAGRGGAARTTGKRTKSSARARAAKGDAPNLTVVKNPTFYTDQKEIDRILDKIAASGIASLTPDERELLDAASKRRRNQ